MSDKSQPLNPELQRIVDRTVASLHAAFFYPDGEPVIANTGRGIEDRDGSGA
jgi:hypothetical protein